MIKRNRTKNGHKNKAYNWRSRVILQLLCFYALIYIAEAFFVPYITAYYKLQGMTPLEIGILSSIGPICAIVVQPFWAIKSDRSGKRLTLLRKIIFMAAVSVMFFPVAKSFSSILFFNILFFSFQTSIVPLGNTMSASKLWNTGYDFSRVRVGGTLGYAFAAAISGPLVEHNQHWIFILTGAAYLLLLFVTLTLKEKGSNESSSELVRAQRYYGSGNLLFDSRNVIVVLIIACATQILVSCYSSFFGPYLVELGFHEADIGRAMMISAIGELPAYFIMNKIGDRFSTFSILIAASVVLAVRNVMLSVASDFWMISAAQLLGGIAYMLVYYNCVVFLSKEMPEELRGRAQSALVVVQVGVGSIVGNIFGGLFVERRGIAFTYQIFGEMLLALLIIIVLLKRFGKEKIE